MKKKSINIFLLAIFLTGGRVIMACRDLQRAEAARTDIVTDTGNENVVVKQLDLASLDSVRAFAKDINASKLLSKSFFF